MESTKNRDEGEDVGPDAWTAEAFAIAARDDLISFAHCIEAFLDEEDGDLPYDLEAVYRVVQQYDIDA